MENEPISGAQNYGSPIIFTTAEGESLLSWK